MARWSSATRPSTVAPVSSEGDTTFAVNLSPSRLVSVLRSFCNSSIRSVSLGIRITALPPKVLVCVVGSAVVEFVWLCVLLLVPLVYVVLAGMTLQRTAFAETDAARDAARAYATAGSDAEGERRAEIAVALAMHDQGVAWTPGGRDYSAGSEFTVDLSTRVSLPFVPSWLCGHRCVAGITVSAHHRERLDCFGGGGGSSAPC